MKRRTLLSLGAGCCGRPAPARHRAYAQIRSPRPAASQPVATRRRPGQRPGPHRRHRSTTRSSLQRRGNLACDVSNISVTLRVPRARRATRALGAPIAVTTRRRFRLGPADHDYGAVPYTVDVNPGVTTSTPDVVERAASCTTVRTTTTQHRQEHRAVTGHAAVAHDRQDRLDRDRPGAAERDLHVLRHQRRASTDRSPMNQVAVTDNMCGGPTYAVRRPTATACSTNGRLDVHVHVTAPGAGVVHEHRVRVRRTAPSGRRPRRSCSPPDTWTVTLTPPPPVRRRAPAPAAGRREADHRRAGAVHAGDAERAPRCAPAS